MASVLWDKDGILLVYYFEKSATITASYYTLPLPKDAGTGLQTVGKLSKGALFLQDNACPHTAAITQFNLADLLKYPVYSPDLAPCSPTLKNKRRHEIFETMRMPCVTDDWFAGQPSAFNLDDLKKPQQQSKTCVELRMEYVEYSICVKV